MVDSPKIAWFATKGSGSNEADRIEWLVSRFPNCVELPFRKSHKLASFCGLWKAVCAERPDLVVMEGTGLMGGLICLLANAFLRIPYVVSSGDAVGPFVSAHNLLAGPFFCYYERLLCRHAAGYIGWTPYLCGRAMTFGTRRTVTAPGWVIGGDSSLESHRSAIREGWGVSEHSLVVGIVGSLVWNRRHSWCYGMDLVRAARRLQRKDLAVVIVGEGSGMEMLRKEAGAQLGENIFLPGSVPLEQVTTVLRAMDVGSLPQSVDGVGAFRYTTKLPEYAGCGLPVITNQVPMAYDIGLDWMWRLPGDAPWDRMYLDGLVHFLEELTPETVAGKRSQIPELNLIFDRSAQRERVTVFLNDLLRHS